MIMEVPGALRRTKSLENSLNKFINLFELKRPTKLINSSTISRTNQEAGHFSGNKMFVRNHSHRSSSRTKKFRKVTKQTNADLETTSSVKDMCRLYENIVLETKNTEEKSMSAIDTEGNNQKLLDDIAVREAKIEKLRNIVTEETAQIMIEKKIATILSELSKLYEQSEVKRRKPYDGEENQSRQRKIASFVEAENEEEAEEYRRSLIKEMDQEIAKMKADGFMDDNDNTRSCQHNSTFLDVMRYNSRLDERFRNSDDSQHTIQNETSEENYPPGIEFGESLGIGIDDALVVVESYNDDGRELIEIEVIIERRTVTLGTNADIKLPIGESQMVFYQEDNDDHTYTLLHDTEEAEGEASLMQKPQHFFGYSPLASNRSTVYSSTSRESSVFDEDDEGIVMGRNNDDAVFGNVRRETFSDDRGVVRIERVACPEPGHHASELATERSVASPVSRNNSTTPARQLEYIIDEIKTTERKYVEDLGKIIIYYKPYIENNTPSHLIGLTGYLFGNIEKIYKKQTKFLEALETCGDYVYGVIRCFIDYQSVFQLYQFYFKNKPKADSLLKDFHLIIKEMQEKFEERLDFSAYLLTPVQRLGKYILFLENIEKQLNKLKQPLDLVQEALNIVRSEMIRGNDAVAVESIVHSPISKLDYGSFKMREKFSISKPRRVEAMVFLFRNVIVFTINDERNLEIFNYYDSIRMNDLRIATFEDFTIHLTDYTKSKKKNNLVKYTYVLDAKTEKLWNVWKKSIEDILWEQLFEVKESVKVMSPHRLPRKNKIDRDRIKSTGSSVFYVEHNENKNRSHTRLTTIH